MSRQIDQEIIQATDELKKDVALTTEIITGNENTVVEVAPGNTVRSPKKMIEDCYWETQQAIEEKFGSLDQAVNDGQSAAEEAKTSETNADKSADAALASKNAAKTSETNAATSASNAKSSETSASSSKTAAQNSASSASTSAANAKTSETNADQSEAAAASSKNSAASSASSAIASESAAAKSAASADEQANRSETQADRAATEADRAGNIIDNAFQAAAIPLPDFHLPLNDNLMIREGIGTPYEEGVPLYHADFTRSTEKIYASKSGKLKIAKIDEPAFESKGLLVEGISTNHISNSNVHNWIEHSRGIFVKSDYSGFKSYKIKVNEDSDQTFSIGCEIPFIKNLFVGNKVTLSVYFRRISGRMRFRIRFSDPTFRGDRSIYTDTVTPSPENDHLFRSDLTELADQWFRFSVTRTIDEGIENNQLRAEVNILLADSEMGSETAFLLPQYEQLPFASSPIATTNGPVARNPDNLIVFGENLMFGNKTVASDWSIISDSVDDVSADSRKHIFGADSEYIGAFIYINDIDSMIKKQYVFDGDTTLASGSVVNNSGKLAYVKNGMNLTNYLDGKNISSLSTKDYLIKRDNRFSIGSTIVGNQPRPPARYLWGHVKNFRVWNHALTSEQIAALG